MFSKSSKKKSASIIPGMCQVCSVTTIIFAIISVLALIAALIGVYKTHFLSTGVTFGTLNDSAALVALALNLFFAKKLSSCCSCQCAVPSKK